MSVGTMHAMAAERHDSTPEVEIVIPVYNEERQLGESIRRLRRYLDDEFPMSALVTIVDNASTDATWSIATRLADEVAGVGALHLDAKGRGRALRAGWGASRAEVVAYMDVDLSTGLDALLPLVAPLLSGHSDVAIGSRLARGAHVERGPKRELISRCYNLLLRVALAGTFSDAQCGFKAMRREAADEILPLVADEKWFFDTELLVVAQRLGFRIHEVPVDWVDDPDSTVDIVRTALDDLRGVWRLARSPRRVGRRRAPRVAGSDEVLHFAGVGVASTVAYLVLFVALRAPLGALAANAVAVLCTSAVNTAAHRRRAAAARARLDGRRQFGVAAALTGVSLLATSAALVALAGAGETALAPELVALGLANAAAAVVRFAILRAWVFQVGQGDAAELSTRKAPAR
ncbi:MAG TPA: dolichyl-phosphate beta-glucosyltransferase [Acidimicrobiales bacterium]|nr:dolichyl-phosphate beta-glucosyltransferase [Acidimicrobiales bacterium]